MLHVLLLIPLLWITQFAGFVHDAEEPTVTSLAVALNERNIHMKDVGGYKFKKGKPVEDLPREQEVLSKAITNASSEGLDAHSVEPFIQAQMDVAKDIQRAFIAGWKAKPEPSYEPRNLDDVRKDILDEDFKILKLIHKQLKSGGFKETDRAVIYHHLTAPHITEEHKRLLFDTLLKIKLKTSQ